MQMFLVRSFGKRSVFVFTLLVATACSSFIQGQAERLELGRRLRRFELAWETADTQHRNQCVPAMKTAVSSFFSLQLSAAGQNMDRAWQNARGAQEIGELEKFAISQFLTVSPVCADASLAEMEFKVSQFYPTDGLATKNMQVVLTLVAADNAVVSRLEIPVAQAMAGCTWKTGALKAGDYRLRVELKTGTDSFVWPESMVSRIGNFDARLVKLETALVGAAGKIDDTVRATVRDSVSLLRSMQKGEVQETDYPANARLEMCETLLNENRSLGEVIGPRARKSDVWLSLAKGRSSVPVRLRAPAESKVPMPVLFLFHGAGGSENMFFETYGAGRVVEDGLKRGWLVIAPRQGLFGLSLDVAEMLDVLGHSFEIDRSKVMLIGHSMGASQVVRQTSLHPNLPIAAVALGGGNRVADASKLTPITWLVAAGSDDFGKAGAKQLHKSLESSGVSSTYHEYPNVEHMVIVQAAIDDVFKFLGDQLKAK